MEILLFNSPPRAKSAANLIIFLHLRGLIANILLTLKNWA